MWVVAAKKGGQRIRAHLAIAIAIAIAIANRQDIY